jgi:hypothetical protein
LNPLAQSINGLRLIAFGFEFGNELKSIHVIILQQKRKGGKGGSLCRQTFLNINSGKPLFDEQQKLLLCFCQIHQ